MFIPTWLLIVIVVIAVSMLLPAIGHVLKSVALVAYASLVLVSIPASLYFFSRGDRQAGWLASLPWISLAALGLWSATIAVARSSLWLHELRARTASSPQDTERLRRKYADAIDLSGTMWQFREDVKHFPSWYSKTNADGTPWTSNVIRKDEIKEIESEDDVRAAGLNPSSVTIKTPYVLYTFSADTKSYAFCAREGVELSGFDHDRDGEALGACGVWVIEKPDRVVLSLKLAHYWGEYADTLSRERSRLEAFKPGEWLHVLTDVAQRVRRDEREKHERWRKQWERERAEKNFS